MLVSLTVADEPVSLQVFHMLQLSQNHFKTVAKKDESLFLGFQWRDVPGKDCQFVGEEQAADSGIHIVYGADCAAQRGYRRDARIDPWVCAAPTGVGREEDCRVLAEILDAGREHIDTGAIGRHHQPGDIQPSLNA